MTQVAENHSKMIKDQSRAAVANISDWQSTSNPVQTVIVDQNTLFREGLIRILLNARFDVVASLPSLEDIHDLSLQVVQPSLFLISEGEDHKRTAEHVMAAKGLSLSSRVVVLGDRYDVHGVVRALRAGCDGYLLKTLSCEAFLKSLDLIMLGEIVLPSAISELVRDAGDEPRDAGRGHSAIDLVHPEGASRVLSLRESQILRCLVEGASNKAIARRFAITEATVKAHLKTILRKIGARNRTQAAIWALEHSVKQ